MQKTPGMLAGLTSADIEYIDFPVIIAAELAPLLNEAATQLIDHDRLVESYWTMTFYLDSVGEGVYSGKDAIELRAGLDENVVEIRYQGRRGRSAGG